MFFKFLILIVMDKYKRGKLIRWQDTSKSKPDLNVG